MRKSCPVGLQSSPLVSPETGQDSCESIHAQGNDLINRQFRTNTTVYQGRDNQERLNLGGIKMRL